MSNPFDDSFGETKVNHNPFDDGSNNNDRRQHRSNVTTNPFTENADDRSQSSFIANDYDDNDDDEYDDEYDDNYDNDNKQKSVEPAEASWQYLGDLPYRRVPIYSNVTWERKVTSSDTAENAAANNKMFHHGLATFPPNAVRYHPKLLNPREVRTLLNNTTYTIVRGCPNGGPIAAITIPILGGGGGGATTSSPGGGGGGYWKSHLYIWTNSGQCLAQIEFPPDHTTTPMTTETNKRTYTAADVLTIGFTNRTTLVIVLRDSFCYTYNLRGDAILPPFFIMPRSSSISGSLHGTSTHSTSGSASNRTDGGGAELLLAHIYEGGVAVLATNKDSALVELLDYHDDPTYTQTSHITARKVCATTATTSGTSTTTSTMLVSSYDTVMTSNYALITPLPTATYANQNFCHYCSIAVLSRLRTSSHHPEIFLSTSDNSVITIDSSTMNIIDVNCRQRIPSPIIDMSFAPNGRFLACFTESSMLTVISTSFETKVLDFDTSEGSNMPPVEMKWCGEDRYVLFLCLCLYLLSGCILRNKLSGEMAKIGVFGYILHFLFWFFICFGVGL